MELAVGDASEGCSLLVLLHAVKPMASTAAAPKATTVFP